MASSLSLFSNCGCKSEAVQRQQDEKKPSAVCCLNFAGLTGEIDGASENQHNGLVDLLGLGVDVELGTVLAGRVHAVQELVVVRATEAGQHLQKGAMGT